MFVHTGVSIPQAILRPPHFHSFAQVAAPPIKGGIRSWNHRSRARMWSLSSAQTSADASQDSTANVMAGWGLAKVNRADWRPAAQQHVWRRTSSARKAASRKACQRIFRRVQKADMRRPTRCRAPSSSASLAGRLEGHSQGTNGKGLDCASAR
jgi:hypothetical protein